MVIRERWQVHLNSWQCKKTESERALAELHSEMDELCREEAELLADLGGIQRVIRTIETVVSDYAEEE